MKLVDQTWELFKKEVVLEWRSKYAFNGVLLYVVSTVFVCYISFNLTPGFEKSNGYKVVWNVLFWIIILFASVNAIAKSFMQESKSRLLYYYSIASPHAIILSKTFYNILLMSLLSILFYFIIVILGSFSFSTVFTMISAIASKAGNNGTLMAILSFPVIIPVILILIRLSKNAMDGLDRSLSYGDIGVLCAINAIVMATALLLFPYLWRD
jgi:heme exporter protein B